MQSGRNMSRRVVSLEESAAEIESRLSRGVISPRTVLGRMSLAGEESSMGPSYGDPAYFPYYFHLGRVIDPARLLCVGLELGLQAGCVLQGCESPASMFAVQPPPSHPYSPRIAVSNVKKAAGRRFPVSVHVGDTGDPSFPGFGPEPFDLAIITPHLPPDPMMDHLHQCWDALSDGGFISVDRLSQAEAGEVFRDFCRSRSVDFRIFKTRYGSGIARK